MAVDVLTEIVIARAVAIVASYAADPSNAPAWYANIASVERETSPPVRLHRHRHSPPASWGRQLAYTYEVTDFVPAAAWSCGPRKEHFRWKRPTHGKP